MKTGEVETEAGHARSSAVECCQECGARMREEFRADEGDAVFVWLECSRNGCPGKALRKIESRAMPSTVWLLGHTAPPETVQRLQRA